MRLFAALFLAAMLADPAFANEPAPEPVLLRVSLQDSVESPLYRGLLDFKREVETRTKGGVAVQIVDKSQFYNDYQVANAVGTGAIEMGLAPLGQYAGEIPATGVFLQPFLFNYDEIIRAAAQPGGEIRTIIDGKILEETGARVLWWHRYGSPVLLSRKQPLSAPALLASQHVRTYDDLTAEVILLCGGTPHVVADAKQSEAFDTNLVTSNLTNILAIREQELWRRADHITRLRLSEVLYAVIINEDIWQGLPAEHRQILTEEAARAEKTVWDHFAEIEAEAYAHAREKGMAVADLPPDDLIAWRVCSSSVLESYMTRAGEVGAKLMAAYAKLRVSPCCNKTTSAGPAH